MTAPSFEEDLHDKASKDLPPVPPPPKNLLKKRVPKVFGKSLRLSLGMHGGLLVITLLGSAVSYFTEGDERKKAIELNRKNAKMAIRVDLVDLPAMTLDELKKIDPTEEIGSQKPPIKQVPETPPPPSETAMKTPEKAAATEDLFEKKPDDSKDRLKILRDQMRTEQRRKELMDKLKGPKKEGGRQVLAGNKLSEGYSTTGDVAAESDVYAGKVKAHLKKSWDVPTWMNASKLSARIIVKLAPDGRVVSKEFSKRSGNTEFDDYVERAIIKADPFPAPPPALKRTYLEDGIEWGFPN